MTDQELRSLMEDRARGLAFLVLTRRDAVQVQRSTDDSDPALRVLTRQADGTLRVGFEVFVRYTLAPASTDDGDDCFSPNLPPSSEHDLGEEPAGVLFFVMRNEDRAYFGWRSEPVLVAGLPSLIRHDRPHCVPVTANLMAEVVASVNAWHDVAATLATT